MFTFSVQTGPRGPHALHPLRLSRDPLRVGHHHQGRGCARLATRRARLPHPLEIGALHRRAYAPSLVLALSPVAHANGHYRDQLAGGVAPGSGNLPMQEVVPMTLNDCCDQFVLSAQPTRTLAGQRFPEWKKCPTRGTMLKIVFECGEMLGGELMCCVVAVDDTMPG